MNRKFCIRCETEKDLSEFNKNARRPDGLSSYCSECERARMKGYHAENLSVAARRPRNIFLEALEEVDDPELYEQVLITIDGVANALMQNSRLKETGARHQAVEFVAACVWKGATAPRR
jgi:hypothetical protein